MTHLIPRTESVDGYSTTTSWAGQNNPLFYLDGNGDVAYANEGCYDRLGYSKDELISHTLKDLDLLVDPEHFMRKVREHLRNEVAWFESVVRHKNGTILPIGVSITDVHYGNRMMLQCQLYDTGEY